MYKQLFIDYMDENGHNYSVQEDRICVSFQGANADTFKAHVFFDKDGENIVQMKCWSFPNMKEKYNEAVPLCNEMNKKWRWLTFSIDNEGDVCSTLDSYLCEDSCGRTCWDLVNRIVNISDQAYPEFAKLRWS